MMKQNVLIENAIEMAFGKEGRVVVANTVLQDIFDTLGTNLFGTHRHHQKMKKGLTTKEIKSQKKRQHEKIIQKSQDALNAAVAAQNIVQQESSEDYRADGQTHREAVENSARSVTTATETLQRYKQDYAAFHNINGGAEGETKNDDDEDKRIMSIPLLGTTMEMNVKQGNTLRTQLKQVFRLLDVKRSGYLTMDMVVSKGNQQTDNNNKNQKEEKETKLNGDDDAKFAVMSIDVNETEMVSVGSTPSTASNDPLLQWFYNTTTGAAQSTGIQQLINNETTLFERPKNNQNNKNVKKENAIENENEKNVKKENATENEKNENVVEANQNDPTVPYGINETTFLNFCIDSIDDMLKSSEDVIFETILPLVHATRMNIPSIKSKFDPLHRNPVLVSLVKRQTTVEQMYIFDDYRLEQFFLSISFLSVFKCT